MYISLFFPSFGVCSYVEFFFDLVRNKASNKVTKVHQKNTKGSWKVYVTWTSFKFWPMIKIFWQLWANKSLTKIRRIIVTRNSRPTLFKLKEVSYSLDKTTVLTSRLLVLKTTRQNFSSSRNSWKTYSLRNISYTLLWLLH